jgi:preprotein translocase subunit SecA
MKSEILQMVEHRIEAALERFTPQSEEWDLDGYREWFRAKFGQELSAEVLEMRNPHTILDFSIDSAKKIYDTRGIHIAAGEVRGRMKQLYHRYLGDHQDLSKGFQALQKAVKEDFDVEITSDLLKLSPDEMVDEATIRIVEAKPEESEKVGNHLLRQSERFILLSKIDEKWKDLLDNMDQLRDVVGLVGYAQVDPKLQFKREGTALFQAMNESIEEDVSSLVFRVQEATVSQDRLARRWGSSQMRKDDVAQFAGGQEAQTSGPAREEKPAPVRVQKVPGRNEPCHCGSGKKYKKCHLPTDQGVGTPSDN